MSARFRFMNQRPPVDVSELPSNRCNPFEDYSDEKFLKEFRMTKSEANYICDLVKYDMPCLGHRRTDLSLQQKVLVCLKTLGSGSFQNCSKDFVEISQPCVSKLLTAFTTSMTGKASRFINMPPNVDGLESLKTGFYQVAKFPGILGCIDGTHIPIIAPKIDEYSYVN